MRVRQLNPSVIRNVHSIPERHGSDVLSGASTTDDDSDVDLDYVDASDILSTRALAPLNTERLACRNDACRNN